MIGFLSQLVTDLFLYDSIDCYFWLFDSFTDFGNGILLLIEQDQPSNSFMSFAYSFNKAPKAYYMCVKVFGDLTYTTEMAAAWNVWPDASQWGN